MYNPLYGLHRVKGQGYRPEVVWFPGVRSLWYREHTGSFPQGWDSLQTEAQVKDVQNHLTGLLCKIPE